MKCFKPVTERVVVLHRDSPALVGIVPRKELWSLIVEQKWYHIPVESAPKNINDVKYLAFYFPSVFGKDFRFTVRYFADIKDIDIKKRIQLFPQEETHRRRDKDYFQLFLGSIKELPNPIPSKRWRRIVHIPTTLKRLLIAEEINDLYWTSQLEEKMYHALKKHNIYPERQYVVFVDRQCYFLDFCIFCKKGNVDLECDGERYHTLPESLAKDRARNNQLTSYGWSVLRFLGKEIRANIGNCIKIVERTINTLKGLGV